MIKSSIKVGKKEILKIWLMGLLVSAVVSLMILSMIQRVKINNLIYDMEASRGEQMSRIEENIMGTFDTIQSDIFIIGDLYKINSVEHGEDAKNEQEELESQYYHYAKNRKIYDQIRILSLDGQELTRINYNGGEVGVVSKEDLQDKSGRYYYQNATLLSKGQIYISPVDLNVENGKIEVPLKPMIRFSSPIYEGDQKIGYVVLNYLAQNIVENIKEIEMISGISDIEILNLDGYYLRANDKKNEFGFMYDDKKDLTIKRINSDLWERIVEDEDGVYYDDERNLYVYRRIYPLYDSDYSWYALSSQNREEIKKYMNENMSYYLVNAAVILLFLNIASWFAIKSYMLKRKYDEKLQMMALYDNLTGLPNRAHFNKKIDGLIEDKIGFALFFMDLDGFKHVNDTYGHDVGDAVLQTASKRFLKSVRKMDFIARMGGDEFTAILIGANEIGAEKVAQKILAEIGRDIKVSHYSCNIGVSIGISVYPEDSPCLDELVKLSDDMMYEAKRAGKNTYKIYGMEKKS